MITGLSYVCYKDVDQLAAVPFGMFLLSSDIEVKFSEDADSLCVKGVPDSPEIIMSRTIFDTIQRTAEYHTETELKSSENTKQIPHTLSQLIVEMVARFSAGCFVACLVNCMLEKEVQEQEQSTRTSKQLENPHNSCGAKKDEEKEPPASSPTQPNCSLPHHPYVKTDPTPEKEHAN